MDHNWPYIAVGYGLTIGVVGFYAGWLRVKTQRARASVRDRDVVSDQ